MTKKAKSYKINPDIVHDEIDGEVILLDIEKGNYYQLKNEAVAVWAVIASQKISSAVAIASSLAKSSKYSKEEIFDSISPFIIQLITEDILIEVKQPKAENDNPFKFNSKEKKVESTFPTPVLLKYTDMQSILLLDPIHETDEEGWPNRKRGTSR